jgi:hypothetical protein
MSRDDQAHRLALRFLRGGVVGFAGFIVFVVGLAGWSLSAVQDRSLGDLAWGEYVSLGFLLGVALLLLVLARRIGRVLG